MKIPKAVALALAFLLAASASKQSLAGSETERVVNLQLPNGDHQPVLSSAPANPKAVIIMLPGGSGDVGLSRDGNVRHGNNFVVRTRMLWTKQNYAVLIPDAIDRTNLRGTRSSPEYGQLVESLIQFAHKEISAPIFLLGTSQGSIAAMNGAARAKNGSLAGLILTESVSVMGGSHETVFDADPQAVRVPALVVANQDDRCDVAPPDMAPKIAAAMINSPDVKVMTVSGGMTQSSRECGSLTPHGYYGIEDRVVGQIGDWMQAHLH